MKAENSTAVSFFDRSVLPWLICSLGMLFYCYNYFLRVSPSVMQNDLMQSLHITAYQFGNLAAFYYYAYTPMQVPIGMIYDRFGARIVLFFACLIAIIGLSIFIGANSLGMASLGRFMIGFGTAFAYIGVLKLASLWLAPNRFATIAGLTTAFGMASAIFSDIYLTKFVQLLGYKNALYTALLVGVVLSVFILLFMRNKPKVALSQPGANRAPLAFRDLLHSLQIVLLKPQMWLIGVIGCLFYLPASVFLDLWAIPYLKTVHNLTPEVAAYVVSMTFIGWIIAGPSIGMLSDYYKRRRLPLMICAVMAAVLLSIVFYVPNISLFYLYVLFFFIGIFCGAHPLCFALGKENNPNYISGTAVAVTNTLIMIGGAIFQPVVGKLLDYHTTSTNLAGAIPNYAPADYTYALSVVPIGLMLAIVMTFFLKETYCESHEEVTKRQHVGSVFDLQTDTGN
ncbi:MAG: MFS transporter [Pseudomonadota bacterium]